MSEEQNRVYVYIQCLKAKHEIYDFGVFLDAVPRVGERINFNQDQTFERDMWNDDFLEILDFYTGKDWCVTEVKHNVRHSIGSQHSSYTAFVEEW